MGKLLLSVMKNVFQFAIYFFVVYLCINFTPLKYVDGKLLNTIAMAGLFLIAIYIGVYYFSKIKYIQNFIRKTKELKSDSMESFYRTFGIIKKFEFEELNKDNFKIEFENQVKKSKRMYFRLLSGYTMFFDERRAFIWNALKSLSPEAIKLKDIKIQLLNKDSIYFALRVDGIVSLLEKRDPQERLSSDEFLRRCKEIDSEFVKLFGADQVSYYQRKYLWRLFLFDDVAFISFYRNEIDFFGGQLSPVYLIPKKRNEAFFEALLDEFNSLYRPLWKPTLTPEKTFAPH